MKKEIFILEDDKDIGFILQYLLFEEGYAVRVYESMQELKSALASEAPDLLLMDVRVPDGNGMELCAELTSRAAFNIPVLMMSADWDIDDQGMCGANGFISKPFDLDDVVSRIGGHLRQTG